MSEPEDVCERCGCDGRGTTAERGCKCGTCHAQPGDQLGWLGSDTARAYQDAVEIGQEWRTRIVLRRVGDYWGAFVPDHQEAR